MTAQEKFITYRTHRNNFKQEFRSAWLQTLLLGYGFIKLKKLNDRLSKLVYKVYNDRIDICGEEVAISSLTYVKKVQQAHQKKYGLADIILKTDQQTYSLIGLEGADQLEEVLYLAIEQEKKRRALQEKAKKNTQQHKPGGLERMNDLVGMWQQGLISEEDYAREIEKYNS